MLTCIFPVQASFTLSKIQAAHTAIVIAPSGAGKTASTDTVEDAARATASLYECLYEDTARLQGVLYARKEVELRFVGQTLSYVRSLRLTACACGPGPF